MTCIKNESGILALWRWTYSILALDGSARSHCLWTQGGCAEHYCQVLVALLHPSLQGACGRTTIKLSLNQFTTFGDGSLCPNY